MSKKNQNKTDVKQNAKNKKLNENISKLKTLFINAVKTGYYYTIKILVKLTKLEQCPRCKRTNKAFDYHFIRSGKDGVNNINKPVATFGKKVGQYVCKHCKNKYERTFKKAYVLCPKCNCLLTKTNKKFVDPDSIKYEVVKKHASLLDTYKWGRKIYDLNIEYTCQNCDRKYFQRKKTIKEPCCPYCEQVGEPKERNYKTNVSRYSKSKVKRERVITANRRIAGYVPVSVTDTYEEGTAVKELYCKHCENIVYRSTSNYTEKI